MKRLFLLAAIAATTWAQTTPVLSRTEIEQLESNSVRGHDISVVVSKGMR